MKACTYQTHRGGRATRRRHATSAALLQKPSGKRTGSHPVLCIAECHPWDAAGTPAGSAAEIVSAFLNACRMYEGLESRDRLGHALKAANGHWAGVRRRRDLAIERVSVTAISMHEAGIDYISTGDHTIVWFNNREHTTLRGPRYQTYRDTTPADGLTGREIARGSADVGGLRDKPRENARIVVGTKLLCAASEETLAWVAQAASGAEETTLMLASEVGEATRDPDPDLYLVSATGC